MRMEVDRPVDDTAQEEVRRRPVKRLAALALLVLLLLALLVTWVQRRPIASDYIQRELASRNVRATYQVTHIGFRTQRLENLVIGDPRNPDLTARWVEVKLSWGWRKPQVTLITARGVRLNARLANGRISLGEVDRLLPPPTGLPFRFPDRNVDVDDVSVRLDTPAGRVGIGLAGRGNLAGGFRGRMAAASSGLDLGRCRLAGVKGSWAVAIDDLRPSLRGPARIASLGCGRDVAVAGLGADLDLTLRQALDGWRGKATLAAAQARIGGNSVRGLSGRVGFDGNSASTLGDLSLASAVVRAGGMSAARAAAEGRYALSLETGAVSFAGDASLRGASTGALGGAAASLASLGGTPLEPIGEALGQSLRRAQAAFDADSSLRLVTGRGYGGVRFEGLALRTRSGARAGLSGRRALTYYFGPGLTRLDGDFALSGGGFPAVRVALAQARAGAAISGTANVQPMRSGSARLALTPVSFTAAPGGTTRLSTVASLDGPIDDGRVEGLVVPISGRFDGRGGFAIGEGCAAARFSSLRINTLRIGPTRLPLCPTGRALVWKAPGGRVSGGAQLSSPRFAGMLGASPLVVQGSRLRFGLDGPSFTSSGVSVALGREGAVNRLLVSSFSGNFGVRGVAGRFSGLSGKLAAVPLLMSQGSGTWRVADGDLLLIGRMQVADEMNSPRFWPLVAPDFRLTLADNRVRAGGWLDDPETGTRIVRADIGHDLKTGEGRADLDVPGIRFDKSYQPEQLTRLTTGVVALVNGVLKGKGEIGWGPSGTRSSGTFSTEDMDLAATFGPVEGLSTTVRFTDLLGLASAPGQLARTGLIRTGIDVLDGEIRYQLLPGLKVRVESGRWPFAGGELRLEETILDFSKPTAKRLTFRVVGLDAARFVQQMEFSNISATGTFDGIIPMVFDERGGRIVDGRLVARPEGGTLSYIGELTDKALGVYGKLAFDALKALRYSKLEIVLNGSLEGEFVAGIELDGIARDPILTQAPKLGGIKGLVAGRALGQLARIPFEFNITVRGPFRALIGTMRSLNDPTILLQTTLPELIRDRPPAPPPVQTQESETVR
jgi:hypothetical protein